MIMRSPCRRLPPSLSLPLRLRHSSITCTRRRTGLRMYSAAFLLTMLGCVELLAQQTGISGRVTDPSKASIADGVVKATGDDGSKFATTTNAQGMYQFPALRAAQYVLRFEAPGFAPSERTV